MSAFAAHPTNVPQWYVNIQSVEWFAEPRLEIGARIAFVAHFLGRHMAYTYEIVELVPGGRFVMRTSDGPFPMATTYTWEDTTDGKTRMDLRNTGEPSGFSWLASFIMVPAMRRANRKDLLLLKSVLESIDPPAA